MVIVRFKLVDFGLAQTEPSHKQNAEGEHHGERTSVSLPPLISVIVTAAVLKGSVNEIISGVMPLQAVRMSPRLAKKRSAQPRLPPATSIMRSSYRKENKTNVSTGGCSTSDQQAFTASNSRGTASRGRRSKTPVGITRRTSRRSTCNHSSAEVCNHCIQR